MSAFTVSALIITRIKFPNWMAFFPGLMSHCSKYFLTVSSIGIASTFASVIASTNLKGALVVAWVADARNAHTHRNAIRLFAGSHCPSASDAAVQPRLLALLFRVRPEGKGCSGLGNLEAGAAVAQGRGLSAGQPLRRRAISLCTPGTFSGPCARTRLSS